MGKDEQSDRRGKACIDPAIHINFSR